TLPIRWLETRRGRSAQQWRFSLRANGMDVNVTALTNQPVEQRSAPQQLYRPPARRFSDHELRSVLFAGDPQKPTNHVVVRRGDHLGTQLSSQRQMLFTPGLLLVVQGSR